MLSLHPIDAIIFFFSSRRRHTRLQGDWSSDVCSSDLCCFPAETQRRRGKRREHNNMSERSSLRLSLRLCVSAGNTHLGLTGLPQIRKNSYFFFGDSGGASFTSEAAFRRSSTTLLSSS